MDSYQIVASSRVIEKILLIHKVDILEVEDAFHNWVGCPLIDDRAQHKTRPPTVWFCSATSEGRILKIAGIPHKETREFVLKSAYEPDDWEIDLYEKNQ